MKCAAFGGVGTGGGGGAVEYLMNEVVQVWDPETEQRVTIERDPPPEVLRGDLDQTQSLIESIDNKWKYTSGVVAFAPEHSEWAEDNLEMIMDGAERVLFPGLDPDQYDISWVAHRHEDRLELHFLTPRMELRSGKAYNAFPPGWNDESSRYEAFQRWMNEKYGLARPDDPARKQELNQPKHVRRAQSLSAYMDCDPEDVDLDESREVIHSKIKENIEAGLFEDRDDIVAYINSIDGLSINREGEDYISVEFEDQDGPAFQTNRRLEGRFYEQGWTAEREAERPTEPEESGDSGPDRERIRELRERLEEKLEEAREYNQRRYPTDDR